MQSFEKLSLYGSRTHKASSFPGGEREIPDPCTNSSHDGTKDSRSDISKFHEQVKVKAGLLPFPYFMHFGEIMKATPVGPFFCIFKQ